MKYIRFFLLLTMFVFCTSCEGQNKTGLPQDNIKSNSGGYPASQLAAADTSKLPMSMVRNVKLARNGDVLIASYLGVFRYDGKSFTNITSKIVAPRFSSFWDVLEDRKGNIWFATKDSGVYCYNGKSLPNRQEGFQHFTTKNGLADNMALHIYEDRKGNIWFGASRYDGKSFRTFSTENGFPSNNIRLLLEDKTGKLWFGAQAENMFVYDGKTFTLLQNKDGKAFNNVWSIIEDRKGNIWFGDVNGLWRYDGSNFINVSHKGAYAIIQDKKGNIWTTGPDEPPRTGQIWSLSCYDAKSLYNEKPIITEIRSRPGMLLGILEDTKGNIWFGSAGPQAGVHRYDGKNITDFRRKENQP